MKLKNYPKKYTSLREWKKLAESKTKAGKMKNQLYNQITAEKIKSKTSDAAITKSFRLDEIIEGLKGKLAAPRVRKRVPVKIEEGIDYAPEVDPYEDMDVEGLLNLEDYVPPQPEKQIAPKPPKYPKYQMDPSYWQMDPGMSAPPAYDDLSIAKEPDESLTIEAPPDEAEDDEGDETEDDEGDEAEDDKGDVNKIFDDYKLPNYDDVQMRLEQPEMTPTKKLFFFFLFCLPFFNIALLTPHTIRYLHYLHYVTLLCLTLLLQKRIYRIFSFLFKYYIFFSETIICTTYIAMFTSLKFSVFFF